MFDNKTILLTGGSGSFGHAFSEYLLTNHEPHAIRIFSRDELKQAEMRDRFHDDRMRFLLGDVRDLERLHLAMIGVDYVVHAAALKRIDACERDPIECKRTNIDGTVNVINACRGAGVHKAIYLSTDKAAHPVTMYGVSKAAGERLFIDGNVYRGPRSRPLFSCTRYGNVMGSRGSVIPTWRDAIKRGDPIQVTDLRMTRFWMEMHEAVQLVADSFVRMQGGETFVPKLPSFTVTDLAEAMGCTGWDVTGLRECEKLHEDLISPDEASFTTDCGNYYRISKQPGERMPDRFSYTSENNDVWLNAAELKLRLEKIP